MSDVLDEGPFFHGTKADLRFDDLLTAGFASNYRPTIIMNHIYFTALLDGAGLAAELAAGNGTPRVFRVEPTGEFENDPNVTDKKFPGNPTRSYRSRHPLRIVEEIDDWPRARRDHQLILPRSSAANPPTSLWRMAALPAATARYGPTAPAMNSRTPSIKPFTRRRLARSLSR